MADLPQWPYENFFGNPPKPFFPHSDRMPYEMPDCEPVPPPPPLLCPLLNITIGGPNNQELTVSFTASEGVEAYILACNNELAGQSQYADGFEAGDTITRVFTTAAGMSNIVFAEYEVAGVRYTCPSQTIVTPALDFTAINARKSVLLHDLCGSEPSTVYLAGLGADISVGAIVYVDSLLTTPLLDFNYIDNTTGEIFVMNIETGEVIYTTGTLC